MAKKIVARKNPVLTVSSADTFSARDLSVGIVGGTNGLGRAIARYLADRGARVVVVGRTFRDEGTPNLEFIQADLQTVDGATRAAEALPAEDLDAVILTSGIITTKQRKVSPDGIELDLAISYVSRFVIIRGIADHLAASRDNRGRIFVMGAPGMGEKGNPEDLNAEQEYKQMPAHMNTVAANEALVLDASQRYPNLSVFGLNPGLVRTDIRANVFGGNDTLLFRAVETIIGLFTPTPETYAKRIVPALFAPELTGESGFHFNNKGTPIEPSETMTPTHVAAFAKATEGLIARVGVISE